MAGTFLLSLPLHCNQASLSNNPLEAFHFGRAPVHFRAASRSSTQVRSCRACLLACLPACLLACSLAGWLACWLAGLLACLGRCSFPMELDLSGPSCFCFVFPLPRHSVSFQLVVWWCSGVASDHQMKSWDLGGEGGERDGAQLSPCQALK